MIEFFLTTIMTIFNKIVKNFLVKLIQAEKNLRF